MAFMQHEITRNQDWWQVDTKSEGTVSYPADLFSPEQVAEMHDVSVDDVEIHNGYGARISAPGYLDCTEWCVFDTAEEAQAYLDEYYPEDDDEEEEEE